LEADQSSSSAVALSSIPATRHTLGDDRDLDSHAGGEVRPHGRPYRFHSGELLLANGVECRIIGQVYEVHKAPDDVVEQCSGSLEHIVDVVEGLLGLLN